jgi:hypothetical protein
MKGRSELLSDTGVDVAVNYIELLRFGASVLYAAVASGGASGGEERNPYIGPRNSVKTKAMTRLIA